MEINVDDRCVHLERSTFHKMVLINNALNDGWTVKKESQSYVFTKKHEGRRECFTEDYLTTFLRDGLDIRRVLDPKSK